MSAASRSWTAVAGARTAADPDGLRCRVREAAERLGTHTGGASVATGPVSPIANRAVQCGSGTAVPPA